MSKKGFNIEDFDAQTARPRPDVAAPTPPPTPTRRTRQHVPAQDAGELAEVCVSLQPETYDLAKSGFLADVMHLADHPDRLRTWVDRATADHAARTPRRRASALATVDELPSGNRKPRSFELRLSTIAAMDEAIVGEGAEGRFISRSEFVTDAIRAAAAQARDRAGGTLPPAPARLSPWIGRR